MEMLGRRMWLPSKYLKGTYRRYLNLWIPGRKWKSQDNVFVLSYLSVKNHIDTTLYTSNERTKVPKSFQRAALITGNYVYMHAKPNRKFADQMKTAFTSKFYLSTI